MSLSAAHPELSGGEADFGRALSGVLVATAAALAMTALPVLAHTIHPALALLLALGLGVFAAVHVPLVAGAAVFTGMLFQNLVVSLASPWLSAGTDFDIVRGYNFVTLGAVWLVSWLRWSADADGASPGADRLMHLTNLMLGAIGVYFVVGALAAPVAAAVYLRNVGGALLMYQAMLLLSRHRGLRLDMVLGLLAGLVVALGYAELLFRDDWLSLTNGLGYWKLSMDDTIRSGAWDKLARIEGRVTLGPMDTFKVQLFNTPLLSDLAIEIRRVLGPMMHPIAYGYATAFFAVFCLFTGRPVRAALLVPLLVFANAKGPIFVLLAAVGGVTLARLVGTRLAFALLVVALALYAALGIRIGQSIGDFHVLGLMGGIYNFIDWPLGHGLGSGGNLNVDFSTLDWSAYQAAGRTPVAVESSVGVLLFQMGLAAFVLFGGYALLAWRTARFGEASRAPLHLAAAFALLTVLVNGLFQEEALFSPSALGLTLALVGLVHGACLRSLETP